MKKLLLAILLLPTIALAQITKAVPVKPVAPVEAQPKEVNPNAPVFKFKEEVWDFGTIKQGIPVTHVFEFENSGKEPLIVNQATASCGCTTPEWTKEPVLPGKTGYIKVTFNAAKEGTFDKNVTLISNVGAAKYLSIHGNVIPNEKQTHNATEKQ